MKKVIDILQEIVDDNGYHDIYLKYSGRGMFGEECVGIITHNVIETIEKAASRGIFGANYDNLGTQFIVYWPKYNALSKINEMELVKIGTITD